MTCLCAESGACRETSTTATSTHCADINRHDLFCIRLHFVPKERIGVKEISAERLLTIDEGAADHFAGGRNFETTAKTMTISRHGSHQKVLVDFAVIGLAHWGHVMQAERGLQTHVPRQSAPTARDRHDAREDWLQMATLLSSLACGLRECAKRGRPIA